MVNEIIVTVNAFLDVLKGEDVIQMYPDLKTMPWYVNQTKNAVMG